MSDRKLVEDGKDASSEKDVTSQKGRALLLHKAISDIFL